MDLPTNSFTLPDGSIHDVPCVFQVWVKKDEVRESIIINQAPSWINYVKDPMSATCCIRCVGGRAGELFVESFIHKNKQSHYFLQTDTVIDLQSFKEWYDKELACGVFTHDNTAGIKSISKSELNGVLNKYL